MSVADLTVATTAACSRRVADVIKNCPRKLKMPNTAIKIGWYPHSKGANSPNIKVSAAVSNTPNQAKLNRTTVESTSLSFRRIINIMDPRITDANADPNPTRRCWLFPGEYESAKSMELSDMIASPITVSSAGMACTIPQGSWRNILASIGTNTGTLNMMTEASPRGRYL
ncbi:hypothetical protein TNCT_730751 [Trichonephila clavata]|uniref:Uncharacterized protein n=1 Tax=Trichonephila clavata TaxID=2740835 RepID=A0A8X6LSR4_TRICU|nr:hypothetical protein TNCT_730751 [Trichonephila clavata]